MATPKQVLGKKGETLAAQHLTAQGYTIVGRNWRCKQGELDIIAHDGTEWVFVEVRTRRAPDTNSAIESVTPAKQARVVAAARHYLAANGYEEVPWRVDLAVVALSPDGPIIEVIRDALGW